NAAFWGRAGSRSAPRPRARPGRGGRPGRASRTRGRSGATGRGGLASQLTRSRSSLKTLLAFEEPRHGAREAGKHILAVQELVTRQFHAAVGKAIDCDTLFFRVNDPN